MAVSTMVGTAKKTMQFDIVFVEVQETNWRGNLQGSKCDEDFMFLWKLFSFYENVPSRLDLVGGFFFNFFHPILQCDVWNWSSLFNMQYVKIFSLVCSVFIIQKVYHVINKYS